MKNKIVISVFICFLLAYVGCKKAELDTPKAPPIDEISLGNSKMLITRSHYTIEELNEYTSGHKGKCNKCHSSTSSNK